MPSLLQDLEHLLVSRYGELISDPGLPPTSVRRLVHGRGRLYPGLDWVNVDYYGGLIFITLYKEVGDEIIDELESMVNRVFLGAPVIIQDRSNRPAVYRLTRGDIPEKQIIQEGTLQFYIHPLRGKGQNIGFFHDMRKGREKLSTLIQSLNHSETSTFSKGDPEPFRVLNLFAYTCSLSVTALVAGADSVVNIDMNGRSLTIGRDNHRLNHRRIPGGYGAQAKFLAHDLFKSFGKLKREGPYTIIIADPPPSQKGSFDTPRDYPKLLRKLPGMMTLDGILFLTHNGRGTSIKEFRSMITLHLPEVVIVEEVEPAEDFPSRDTGRGLKILICRRKQPDRKENHV